MPGESNDEESLSQPIASLDRRNYYRIVVIAIDPGYLSADLSHPFRREMSSLLQFSNPQPP